MYRSDKTKKTKKSDKTKKMNQSDKRKRCTEVINKKDDKTSKE